MRGGGGGPREARERYRTAPGTVSATIHAEHTLQGANRLFTLPSKGSRSRGKGEGGDEGRVLFRSLSPHDAESAVSHAACNVAFGCWVAAG